MMKAFKIKKIADFENVPTSAFLQDGVLKELNPLNLKKNAKDAGRLMHHLKQGNVELYTEQDVLINGAFDANWKNKTNDKIETRFESIPYNLKSFSDYLNSL